MQSRPLPLFALGLVLLAGAQRRVCWAQSDFFTSSPGSLSRSHAQYDSQAQCGACHEDGKTVSRERCLGCHDHADLRARIQAGKGYHATTSVRSRACEDCHLEHRGRDFDVMGWEAVGGTERFDHRRAGWRLVGKHAAAECSECHERTNRQGLRLYLGEKRVCAGCHRDDQPHGFTKTSRIACDQCHTERGWKPQREPLDFEHGRGNDSALPLAGKHRELACTKCHPDARFNLPGKDPSACDNCHDNEHARHFFGTKACSTCHSPERASMADVRFSHKSKRAGSLRTGKHRRVPCTACHTRRLGKRKPQRACTGCHADRNPHGSRFEAVAGAGADCNLCHSTASWRPTEFRHGRYTRYKLRGRHAQTSCRSCHRGERRPFTFERLNDAARGCTGCHAHAEVHGGEFHASNRRAERRACLRCHKGIGVRGVTAAAGREVHSKGSRWPLVLGHAGVDCTSCHRGDGHWQQSSECGDACHQDSLHRGALGKKCSRCHVNGTWKVSDFDHGQQADWPLEGKHAAVTDCESCHPDRRFADTSSGCSACHAADDIHENALGARCEQCHRPNGERTFDHDRQTEFDLRGAHRGTPCVGCHATVAFETRSTQCSGCHRAPAGHRARYGSDCQRCHDATSFANTVALHEVGAFSLGGAHERIACDRCHRGARTLRGTGELCVTCHRRDDVHQNGLSPRCGECHSQITWTPARFDHAATGCSPAGTHRSLPCGDCHKNGNYGAVSPQCFACHGDDALGVTEPDHAGLFECGQCHNIAYWSTGAGTGPAHGRESICW